MTSLALTGGSVVTPAGSERQDVRIDGGFITHIGTNVPSADRTIDCTGKVLFPGLIDCHVHFREPGYEHKATMASEMKAARAGGITTVCEMPNTNPPTVTIAALADKVRRAEKIQDADLRFFFGVTEEPHLHALRDVWTSSSIEIARLKARSCGVKAYLDHSTGNQKIAAELLDALFALCGELDIPLVAHCEDPAMNAAAAQKVTSTDVSAHSLRRPPESEAYAIEQAIGLARKHGTHLHVAHLSTMQGVDLVRQAKKDGLPVTCEVAPHHLFLSTEDYARLGTFGKMNPPLRPPEHCAALWDGITDGTVDCIATDHAPHTLAEKQQGEPLQAPSGVPGVETSLVLLLSVVAGALTPPHARLTYPDILRLCFTRPNEIFSLARLPIAIGASTPIVIVDPAKESVIMAKNLHGATGWTPYEGMRVCGAVVTVV